MKKILLFVILSLLIITGCTNKSIQKNSIMESEEKMSNIKVIINDQSYDLKLEDNSTVEEFIGLLPQEFSMKELNGNEKYVYMDYSLTTDSYNPIHIVKGDIMLYGNNCLVLFYKSFETSYNYTKIGHIDNLPDLGNENITIKFE